MRIFNIFKKPRKRNIIKSETIVGVCTFLGALIGLIYGGFDRDDYYLFPLVGASASIVLSALLITLFEDRRNRKKIALQKKQKEDELRNLDTEKLDKIIGHLKLNTSKEVYRINLHKTVNASLTDSKFGGFPYWPEGKEYPSALNNGEKLLLLAQFNFEKECFASELLPRSGMLQFFVADDDLTGCEYGNNSSQHSFRVVYHSAVSEPISIDRLKAIGVTASTELDTKKSYFPFFDEYRLEFEKSTDCICACIAGFDEKVGEALNELFGEELNEAAWKHFNSTEFDYLTNPLNTFGHKILGYPAFTQDDPRAYTSDSSSAEDCCTVEHYDVLLLQIDSMDDIMWGDCGVCNFFINSEALKNLDFSDVYYTWDCY